MTHLIVSGVGRYEKPGYASLSAWLCFARSAATRSKACLRATAFERIETAGPPQLRLALRAELERLSIALLGVVRAVHAALIGDAVTDAEHVAGLMRGRHGCADGAQGSHGGAFIRIAIASHGPYADAFRERGLPEDEVPARSRPQIVGGDTEHRCVTLHTAPEQHLVQQMCGQQLRGLAQLRVRFIHGNPHVHEQVALRVLGDVLDLHGRIDHEVQPEEGLQKVLRDFEYGRLALTQGTDGHEAQRRIFRHGRFGHERAKLPIALARLLVFGQPVTGLWRSLRLE